jgi:4,5-DOPA dioxygenase extradiol
MNAIEENAFTKTLEALAPRLPRPKAVCVVCAHWVTAGSEVLAVEKPKTIHDFYGFPKPLYEVQCPAPGAPQEAKRLAKELQLVPDRQWVFDHGAWSMPRHRYPVADIPVFQVSLDQYRTLEDHLALGQELASLRQRGVLILGSGNLVHNLHRMGVGMKSQRYPWALEFDTKVKVAIEKRDLRSLSAPDKWSSTLVAEAHPTLEHYVPILYCVGSVDEKDEVSYPYEGFDLGSVSMRMVLFGKLNSSSA